MVLGFIFGTLYLLWEDVLYWAKYAVSYIGLRLQKRTLRSRFDLYDYEAINEPEKIGVLAPNEERILEAPFPDEHLQKGADEIFIYGANSNNQVLVVRISRTCNDVSEAWIYLKLADDHWYELEQTNGYQRNFGDKCMSFTCGGLQMYYLCAMRRWRIVYVGMLRRRNYENDTENKEVFVKFTLIWTASSDVYDASYDLDLQATAEGMANAKWKSPFPPVDRVPKALNFYSQSGVVNGIVSIEDEPDTEIYLFGERIRNLGDSSYLAGCKFKHVFCVIPKTGLFVHLGKATFPNTLHNVSFGFIVHPNTTIHPVRDVIIISNMSDINKKSRNLTISFTAGELYELKGNFFGNRQHFKSNHGWQGYSEMLNVNFEMDGVKGIGYIVQGEVSPLSGSSNQNPNKVQSVPKPLSSSKPLTVFFADEASHSPSLTGGKGSSLGKLTKLSDEMKSEFIVPRGIVVTTAAYEEFLNPDILDKIENLKNIVYGISKGDLQEACKTVQSSIEYAYLPDKITKEIDEKLNKLFDGQVNLHKFAVRSSATGEDTDQMSAAGQMDTFLGIQGLKAIFTAVKKCWASQFGHIATEYKRQNGQILNSPMAVVVQEMVECEAAGVLFTCDPVTNNPSVVFITGNYGLGESVVSGSEEPDTIILQKLPGLDVAIKEKNVGMKQHRIVITDQKENEDEGTVIEDVPEDQRNQCCISDEMVSKLGKLALKIEDYFKSPRDIEWGIKHNTIYMLQSRPVTTGAATSDFEIMHELDSPLRCETDFFTTCNVGEVQPGATSPLGVDVVVKYFSTLFMRKDMMIKQRNPVFHAKYYANGLNPFCQHMHLEVVDLITRVDDADTKVGQSMMMGIFGRILDYPELRFIIKQRKYRKLSTNISVNLAYLWNLFFASYGGKELFDEVFNKEILPRRGKTAKEIFDLNMKCCSQLIKPLDKHIVCLETSSLWNMYLFSILADAKGTIDNDVYGDFAKLLTSYANVESVDVPSGMQHLAHAIIKEMTVEEFQAMSVEDVQKWLETTTSLAGYQYRQFLKRHGHRCLKEFDVNSVRWGEDPSKLIKLLQSMASGCKEIKEKKAESLSEILPRLATPLDWKAKLLLKFILPNARRSVRERETYKSSFIKSIDNIRKGFCCLSEAMVAEGYLPDSNLMFFLTIDEIRDVLETRNPRLLARANHRRKLYPYLDSLQFPDISQGRPVPLNEQSEEKFEYIADLTMKGIPVSQGSVKGYARVAVSLQEAAELKPGEILITHSTDIGWSPYFPILGGVVTELGGLVSHGAVVSREYGLPCVVGIHGVTKQFMTGDYVLLDGDKGLLQRISPPEN